ncbi:HNH endonuclease [Bacillus cereus]|nr:HNH endonuclease [Bacillus cereus]
MIENTLAKGVASVPPIFKGVEILLDGSVVRTGTNYSGKSQEAHDASKASIQSRISNLESGGVKGTGNSSKIVNKANLNNIDEFINGTKKFDDVINDYVKLYSEKIISNKTWSWNKSLHGGANLTARQKRMIKEKAVADGLVPDVKVIKADGMRYGFADFKSAGLVVETKQLWLMSDEEQFKWLDNAIGGRPEGMTWHHTEVPGKMELVPFGIHNITIHNGGRSAGMWADAPR